MMLFVAIDHFIIKTVTTKEAVAIKVTAAVTTTVIAIVTRIQTTTADIIQIKTLNNIFKNNHNYNN